MRMRQIPFLSVLAFAGLVPFGAASLAGAASPPAPMPADSASLEGTVEVHQRLVLAPGERAVALTLDACGGAIDSDLLEALVEHPPRSSSRAAGWNATRRP
jgi:hypothetical protein